MTQPIGIFDSGIGGLPTAEQIHALLPDEQIIYFADSKFAPYGEKTESEIIARAVAITDWFISQNAKAIVVACNTATMIAIKHLRSHYSLPFIGVEPGVKPGAIHTKTGVIGVLATPKTLTSQAFHQLAQRVAGDIQVEIQPCPKFVHLVESLQLDSEQTLEVAQQYIQPLLDKKADTIILGCTHFSYLKSAIEKVVGKQATIISTETAVASEVKRRLTAENLLTPSLEANSNNQISFFTNGDLDSFQQQLIHLSDKTAKAQYINI